MDEYTTKAGKRREVGTPFSRISGKFGKKRGNDAKTWTPHTRVPGFSYALRIILSASRLRSGDLNAVIGKDLIDHALQAQWMRSNQTANLMTTLEHDERWNGLNT